MSFTTIFFDLDDTLYPHESGLWNAIRDRMGRYMWEVLQLPEEQVPQIRKYYFETYGTTLRGLQVHHSINADDYLAYVHNVPLQEYIQPEAGLREMIMSLPQKRWIFTNADDQHATRVLKQLNLMGCFEGIIDLRATNFACKPESGVYQLAMQIAGEADPRRCVFLDDSVRNLAPAHEMGMFTVLVGGQNPDPAADVVLSRLRDLPAALPSLWQTTNQNQTMDARYE